MGKYSFLYIVIFILFSSCDEPDFVQYFEYTDHNVLNIGSRLTDLIMTNDSNTLIAADKGNNRVLFIDVSTDDMSIVKSLWVGSEPTSLDLTVNDEYLLIGLQGASSIAVVSVQDKSLLGTINLDEDNVFDIEYVDLSNQLIVSYVSSNPAYNKTQIYGWNNNLEGNCSDLSFTDQNSCESNGDTWTVDVKTPWDDSQGSCSNLDFIDKQACRSAGYEWFADYKVFLETPYSYVNYAGPISISDNEEYIYILDKYNGPPYRVYRYDVSVDGLQNKINSSNIADGPISLHDLEYVPNFGVVVAIGGTDFIDNNHLDHSPVYALDDLNHIANLDVGSTPLAITSYGENVYISPTDVDDNGMFIIEYNIETQLQTNYYQVAGLLGSHSLIIDFKGEYLYAAVDDLSDQDTAEPYNGSSFNVQRIKILPEATYPINDF